MNTPFDILEKGEIVSKPNNTCTVGYKLWLVKLTQEQASDFQYYLMSVGFLLGMGWRYEWLMPIGTLRSKTRWRLKPPSFDGTLTFDLHFPIKMGKYITTYFMIPKGFEVYP